MKDQYGNKITEHEFTKDIGHRTEAKTIDEMFEEYAEVEFKNYPYGKYNDESAKRRMKEIIQEVTKQIQSDLLKEILGKESLVSGMIWIGDIKKLAEEKEITLN